jgi:hypothetical protein
MCVDVSFDAWMLWQMAVLVKIKLCAETALYLATEVYIDIHVYQIVHEHTCMHHSATKTQHQPFI